MQEVKENREVKEDSEEEDEEEDEGDEVPTAEEVRKAMATVHKGFACNFDLRKLISFENEAEKVLGGHLKQKTIENFFKKL